MEGHDVTHNSEQCHALDFVPLTLHKTSDGKRSADNKMIEYFNNLYKSIDLNERYEWDIPFDCPIKLPLEAMSNYHKNKYLKLNLREKLFEYESLSPHYWVIQNWGGIKSFKRNQNNDEKIKKFYGELRRQKLSRNSFSTISSLSKVSSFCDCHNYFIYDARAIFALNWIIFKCESPDTQKLFPQPIGRNSIINKYDLGTIVNLSNKNFSYYNLNEAYFQYCKLIKKINLMVCPSEEAFVLEMLLFVTSVKEIAEDISETIKININ